MLSILIPIYNFSVITLVRSLQQQCEALQIDFEIICFDDLSQADFKASNKELSTIPSVFYKELPHNLGRAKIRNALAQSAQYPFLLFMDCDSKITSPDYIKNYVQLLDKNTLLYGGRVYAPTPPKNKNKILHYSYGKNREEISSEERNLLPYYSFMTNNFLIPKHIFLKIQFDSSIEGYGHEDTQFGAVLEKRKVAIKHIDNALEHIGLEDWELFLKKQKRAIYNLWRLKQKDPVVTTRLWQTFIYCKKWKVQTFLYWVLNRFKSPILLGLKSRKPKLFLLDLFKLHYLLEIDLYGVKNISS